MESLEFLTEEIAIIKTLLQKKGIKIEEKLLIRKLCSVQVLFKKNHPKKLRIFQEYNSNFPCGAKLEAFTVSS
jgi:hypothetical protein